MGKITSGKDLLMLLLYARGRTGEVCEPVVGRTRLMKMVFLFDKELRREVNLRKAIDDAAFPSFEPYDFGPFSKDVCRDLDFLQDLGFVQSIEDERNDLTDAEVREAAYWEGLGHESETESETAVFPTRFVLTRIGRSFVEDELLPGLDEAQLGALDEFKARCTSVKLGTLLRYVYTKYPDYAAESRIKDQVLGG